MGRKATSCSRSNGLGWNERNDDVVAYTVESSPDLTSESWEPVAELENYLTVLTSASAPQGYQRVRATFHADLFRMFYRIRLELLD